MFEDTFINFHRTDEMRVVLKTLEHTDPQLHFCIQRRPFLKCGFASRTFCFFDRRCGGI